MRKSKLLVFPLLLAILFAVSSCGKNEVTASLPAQYGTYGADFARELASLYPYRKAYSVEETMAGLFIRDEFNSLGFDSVQQNFTSEDGRQSSNYYIKVEGKGFLSEEDGSEVRRIAIIGAHYDSKLSSDEAPEDSSYDAISDNASGVGCLMTIASQLSLYENLGFDVYVVAFGAGNDNFMGARHFYESLPMEEKNAIEVMYCIDSIYAGDKMYASSGLNSLINSQKYSMRRKLYQVYDVAYDCTLNAKNSYNLLYNESNVVTDLNVDGVADSYREVSVNRSDYVVFDEANIPIVYFDSYDYFWDSLDKMKETKNLSLQEFGGQVSGTPLDSSSILDGIYKTEDTDLLETRINNTSFLILESMMKGSDFGLTREQYSEYLIESQKASTEVSESSTN